MGYEFWKNHSTAVYVLTFQDPKVIIQAVRRSLRLEL